MTSSADANANGDVTRLYVLVVICEIGVVAALWLLGRIYG